MVGLCKGVDKCKRMHRSSLMKILASVCQQVYTFCSNNVSHGRHGDDIVLNGKIQVFVIQLGIYHFFQ